MNILGQDRHGVNLFEGDVIGIEATYGKILPKYKIIGSMPNDPGRVKVKTYLGGYAPEPMQSVDSSLYVLSTGNSPERSNFDRLFSHIGTNHDVVEAWYQHSSDPDNREFWFDLTDDLGAVSFLDWLKSPYTPI